MLLTAGRRVVQVDSVCSAEAAVQRLTRLVFRCGCGRAGRRALDDRGRRAGRFGQTRAVVQALLSGQ